VLRVAVIGCGDVAVHRHLPALRRLRGRAELVAICDGMVDRAQAVGKAFGVPRVYSELGQLLDAEKLDVVDLCTPPTTHAELAIRAMKAGCHVLVEKPMAPTVAECDRMIEVSTMCCRSLGVIHNARFNHGYTMLRGMANSGRVGTVCGIRICWSTPPSQMLARANHWAHKLPGGLIGETVPHLLYLSIPFTGAIEDVSVNARGIGGYPWAEYDNFWIHLEGSSCVASITLSYTNSSHIAWLEVIGSNGALRLDLLSRVVTHYHCSSLREAAVLRAMAAGAVQSMACTAKTLSRRLFGQDRAGQGHNDAIRSFLDSIRDGVPFSVGPHEARETVRVAAMVADRVDHIRTSTSACDIPVTSTPVGPPYPKRQGSIHTGIRQDGG